MKAFFFYSITIVLILWIQVVNDHYTGGLGFSANLVLVAVLSFGLSRGPLVGELLGFVWGLLVDAASLGFIGIHALLYTLAGYMAGVLKRQLDESKMGAQSLFTLGISILYMGFSYGLQRLFSYGIRPISWAIVAQPLSNAILAPILFWGLNSWSQLWDPDK